ncbi:thiamine-phosphate kinase [Kytococcus sedentarius]|uniref:thiamine-phosphate kinase n=1 Tax=Kytococcus sedentarius TaxID=1276 RepID=UPI0035BBCDB9
MALTLADLSENDLLPRLWEHLPTRGRDVLVGPGDDAAVVHSPGAVVVTTDTMVRGADWLDEWSTGWQVGAKAVAQNLADVTAMGGRCTSMVLTLVADAGTPVEWVEELAAGVGERATEAGIVVTGGDLSSAPVGTRMVSITALGSVGDSPVLRSGARPGDQLAVSGPLGRSAVGLSLLQAGRTGADEGSWAAECLEHHRAPRADADAGETAARAGATAMLDVSDGLGRDGTRLATASGVGLLLDGDALAADVQRAAEALGGTDDRAAWEAVLTGGEEHCLLASFPASATVPAGWRVIGRCVGAVDAPAPVSLDGRAVEGGWDHFRA